MAKEDYIKTLEKIDNNPAPQNLRRGISLLIKLTGFVNISHRRSVNLETQYSYLKKLYGRLHPQPA